MTAPTLKFIPATTASGSTLLNLADIPQDVKDQTEEVYEALKTNAGRMLVTFETEAELNLYIRQVTSYCAQRMVDGKPAPIHFRKSPTRNQPKNEAHFRITDVPTKNEADSKAINDAAAKVTKAAAK